MRPKNMIYKMSTIILALLSPIIYIIFIGFKGSISSYWTTDLQPLFIFTNAVTSYYLFDNPKWRISSSLLLLLTAFSVEGYLFIHNILALSFFISSFVLIFLDKRYWYFVIPYICSLFWYRDLDNMLVTEIISVYVICLYHSVTLLHYIKLYNKKNKKIKNGKL